MLALFFLKKSSVSNNCIVIRLVCLYSIMSSDSVVSTVSTISTASTIVFVSVVQLQVVFNCFYCKTQLSNAKLHRVELELFCINIIIRNY